MRDGKGPSEKVMGRVSRVPLRVVIPIGVALLVVMMVVSVGTGPVGLGVGAIMRVIVHEVLGVGCLLYTSPSPRDQRGSRMPSSA